MDEATRNEIIQFMTQLKEKNHFAVIAVTNGNGGVYTWRTTNFHSPSHLIGLWETAKLEVVKNMEKQGAQ